MPPCAPAQLIDVHGRVGIRRPARILVARLHGCLAVGLDQIGQSYPMARLRRISTDVLGRKETDLPNF